MNEPLTFVSTCIAGLGLLVLSRSTYYGPPGVKYVLKRTTNCAPTNFSTRIALATNTLTGPD